MRPSDEGVLIVVSDDGTGMTADQTRDKVNEYADRTSAYVQDQPLKSMAIAAAAGALVAMLLGRRR